MAPPPTHHHHSHDTAADHVTFSHPVGGATDEENGMNALRHRRRRSRTIYTRLQLESLEQVFRSNKYPDINSREALADAVDLTEARVQVRGIYYNSVNIVFITTLNYLNKFTLSL